MRWHIDKCVLARRLRARDIRLTGSRREGDERGDKERERERERETETERVKPRVKIMHTEQPEKPNPGASACAEVPRACGEIHPDFRADRAKGTGFSIEDGAHRVANQASQSVGQYLSLFSHNG